MVGFFYINMKNLKIKLNNILNEVNLHEREISELSKSVTRYEKNLSELENLDKTYEELKNFLIAVSEKYRGQICSIFNSLITEALSKIFEKDIIFNIKISTYRNQPAVEVFLTEEGIEVSPQKSSGGGINDIISLVVRIIFIHLQNSSKIIILDEPLKFLSLEYLENASSFISEICERLGIQIIMVSHKQDIQIHADHVIHLKKEKDFSISI